MRWGRHHRWLHGQPRCRETVRYRAAHGADADDHGEALHIDGRRKVRRGVYQLRRGQEGERARYGQLCGGGDLPQLFSGWQMYLALKDTDVKRVRL